MRDYEVEQMNKKHERQETLFFVLAFGFFVAILLGFIGV